jgi:hypothetical protein
MKTLSCSQLSEIEAGGPGFWCVASVVGWVGSLCALACATGGVGAILAISGGHIVTDISGGISCAQWLASLKEEE